MVKSRKGSKKGVKGKTFNSNNNDNSYNKKNLVGSWSFLIGLFFAIILGIGFTGTYQKEILWAVFLLGIVVGLLNIAVEEINSFLVSGTVLVLISFLGIQVGIFDSVAPAITNMLTGILTLFVPATIIAALKSVFSYAYR